MKQNPTDRKSPSITNTFSHSYRVPILQLATVAVESSVIQPYDEVFSNLKSISIDSH